MSVPPTPSLYVWGRSYSDGYACHREHTVLLRPLSGILPMILGPHGSVNYSEGVSNALTLRIGISGIFSEP